MRTSCAPCTCLTMLSELRRRTTPFHLQQTGTSRRCRDSHGNDTRRRPRFSKTPFLQRLSCWRETWRFSICWCMKILGSAFVFAWLIQTRWCWRLTHTGSYSSPHVPKFTFTRIKCAAQWMPADLWAVFDQQDPEFLRQKCELKLNSFHQDVQQMFPHWNICSSASRWVWNTPT